MEGVLVPLSGPEGRWPNGGEGRAAPRGCRESPRSVRPAGRLAGCADSPSAALHGGASPAPPQRQEMRSCTRDSALLQPVPARAARLLLQWHLACPGPFEGLREKATLEGCLHHRVHSKVTAQWTSSFWVLSESFRAERC